MEQTDMEKMKMMGEARKGEEGDANEEYDEEDD